VSYQAVPKSLTQASEVFNPDFIAVAGLEVFNPDFTCK